MILCMRSLNYLFILCEKIIHSTLYRYNYEINIISKCFKDHILKLCFLLQTFSQ